MNLTPEIIRQTLCDQIEEMQSNAWQYTSNPRYFTRNRKISFADTILSTISMQKSSEKVELLKYFDYSDKVPSQSAFIQQRNKIPATTFESLYYSFTNSFTLDNTLKGYDPIAVDGSDIYIPRDPSDTDTYRITDQNGTGFNMIHLNAAYHLLSHLYIDAILQPANKANEYLALCDIIDRYAKYYPERKPLYIADRGYSSLNVFAHAIENNAFFLIRAREALTENSKSMLATLDLPDTPEYDITFERWLTRRITKTVKAEPEVYKTIAKRVFDYLEPKSKKLYYITFRIVRFILPNGNTETLFTNLPKEDFSIEELKELYRMRWGIETSFRDIKYACGLLFFHSRKKQLVLQEIYAKLILYNYCELITGTIATQKKTENCKYSYQINFSVAIAICLEYLKRHRTEASIDVISLLSKELVPVRPNRNSPRHIRARTATTFQYR